MFPCLLCILVILEVLCSDIRFLLTFSAMVSSAEASPALPALLPAGWRVSNRGKKEGELAVMRLCDGSTAGLVITEMRT